MRLNLVCRLCLGEKNLSWFLEYHENMKDIVFCITGVEILTSDLISQKICIQCAELVTKIWHFRKKSLKSDQYLRDLCEKLTTEGKLTISNESCDRSMCDTNDDQKKKTNIDERIKNVTNTKSKMNIHKSVRSIFKSYPNIKIPRLCIKSDISPFVSLPKWEVEEYLMMQEINLKETAKLAVVSSDESTSTIKNEERNESDESEKSFLQPTNDSVETVLHEEKDVSLQIKNNFQNLICTDVKRKSSKESVATWYMNKHCLKFKCPFCHKYFKSNKSKRNHIRKNCSKKKIIASSPRVELIKLEKDKTIVNKYTTILKEFNLLPNENGAEEHSLPNSMEISSMDEDNNQKILEYKVASPVNNATPKYPTVSIVKPDIRIQNDNFSIDMYDSNCSDELIVKDLLLSKQIHAILPTDKSCQTNPHPDITVRVNATIPSITLKEITKHINNYPLPVFIEDGATKISFHKNVKNSTKKRFYFWNTKPKKPYTILPSTNVRTVSSIQKKSANSAGMSYQDISANSKFPNVPFQSMFAPPVNSYNIASPISSTVITTTTPPQTAMTTTIGKSQTTFPQTVNLSNNINYQISNIPSSSILKTQKIVPPLPPSNGVQPKTVRPQILISSLASKILSQLQPKHPNISNDSSSKACRIIESQLLSTATMENPAVSSSLLSSPLPSNYNYLPNEPSINNLTNAYNASTRFVGDEIIHSTTYREPTACTAATNMASVSLEPSTKITTTNAEPSSDGACIPAEGFIRVKPLCELR